MNKVLRSGSRIIATPAQIHLVYYIMHTSLSISLSPSPFRRPCPPSPLRQPGPPSPLKKFSVPPLKVIFNYWIANTIFFKINLNLSHSFFFSLSTSTKLKVINNVIKIIWKVRLWNVITTVLILDGSSTKQVAHIISLLKQKSQIDDCCRFKQMPYTDQIIYFKPNIRILFYPC